MSSDSAGQRCEPRITDLSLDVLKRFYQVRSNRGLIAAMAAHIDKLQDERISSLQSEIHAVRQVRA